MTCDLPAMCPCAGMLVNIQNSGDGSCPAASFNSGAAVDLHQWEQHLTQKLHECAAYA